MIQTTLITREEDFLGLEQEWKALLPQTPADSIFLTWEWVSTWWKIFGDGKSLRVLTFRRGDKLIGIAPFHIRKIKYYGILPLQALMFLGTGESVRSEYQDLIIKPGNETEVTEKVLLWTQNSRDWDIAILKDIRSESTLIRHLESPARRSGLPRLVWKSDNSYSVKLAGSYPDYLKAASRQLRKNITKETRNLEARYSVRHRVIGPGDDLNEWMEILSNLHQQRMRQKHLPGKFAEQDYSRFHREISRSFFARGWLFLTTLDLDNIPRAALYGFRYRNKIYGYQSGFDPDFAPAGVMQVLLSKIIEFGFSAGLAEFDLLAGGYPHKVRLATTVRRLFSGTAFNRTPAGRAARLSNLIVAAARRTLKQRDWWRIFRNLILAVKEYRFYSRPTGQDGPPAGPRPEAILKWIDGNDAAALAELAALKGQADIGRIAARLARGHRCLAARCSGRVAGCIWIDPAAYHLDGQTPAWALSPGEAFVYDCLTGESWKGMNLYPLLLETAAQILREDGFETMSMLINTANRPAIRAAGKAGFREGTGGFKAISLLGTRRRWQSIPRA